MIYEEGGGGIGDAKQTYGIKLKNMFITPQI